VVSGVDIVIAGTIDRYMEKKVTPDEVYPYQQLHQELAEVVVR